MAAQLGPGALAGQHFSAKLSRTCWRYGEGRRKRGKGEKERISGMGSGLRVGIFGAPPKIIGRAWTLFLL